MGRAHSSTRANRACRMSSWRARTNHAGARAMKTKLSATCMAFWRNARNWEKGGLPMAQSQRPSALRKSLPFRISYQSAPSGSARRKALLPGLGSTIRPQGASGQTQGSHLEPGANGPQCRAERKDPDQLDSATSWAFWTGLSCGLFNFGRIGIILPVLEKRDLGRWLNPRTAGGKRPLWKIWLAEGCDQY